MKTCGSAVILSSTSLSKDTVLTLGMCLASRAVLTASVEMMDLAYSLLAMLGKSC